MLEASTEFCTMIFPWKVETVHAVEDLKQKDREGSWKVGDGSFEALSDIVSELAPLDKDLSHFARA
jgi:hypothetical protein